MATRALIGYLDDNRVLTSTYNHYDGYPDHLGKILDTYYSRNKRARDVANKGYISYFEDDGDIVSKNPEKNPYKLNLNGEWEDALYSIAQEIDSFGADFAYIWYEEDGDWVEIKNTGTQSMIDQLANQLASAATMFGPVDEQIEDELNESDIFMVDKNIEENIMEQGYEAKWANFLAEAKDVDFDVIKRFIQDDTKRGDKVDPALDTYIDSLKRDFEAGGDRRSAYDDYEMDDYVEDFENYEAEKRDA